MVRRNKTAIIVEKKERILYITINRPEVRNALNLEALNELNQTLLEYRDDDELRVAIITGAGDRAFCSGMDIKDAAARSLSEEVKDKPWRMPWNIFRSVEVWKPLIAAINGSALGGGLSLALACDLRVASQNAMFGSPEVSFGGGGPPAWGQTQLLVRNVPRCKAVEILMLGLPIDAQEAYRIGLVNRVVPPDQVMPAAQEWAVRLSGFGPGVKFIKEALFRGSDLSYDDGLRLEDLLAKYSRASAGPPRG